MKGKDSYDGGSKQSARGWIWNRVVDRLVDGVKSPSEKRRILSNCTVVYLVGPDDLDRECAISKGLRSNNLIAVDVVESRVKAVRKDGGMAVNGSIQKVLCEWPKGWKIDALILDFCGGLTSDELLLPTLLPACLGVSSKTVVAINLLRGRDAASNTLRNGTSYKGREPWRLLAEMPGVGKLPEDCGKHRGFLASFVHWYTNTDGLKGSEWAKSQSLSMNELATIGWKRMKASFNSYPSRSAAGATSWFDSVVFSYAFPAAFDTDQDWLESGGKNELRDVARAVLSSMSHRSKVGRSMPGKLAALRAVRTKKNSNRKKALSALGVRAID